MAQPTDRKDTSREDKARRSDDRPGQEGHRTHTPDRGAELARARGQPATGDKDARGMTRDSATRTARPAPAAGPEAREGVPWRSADPEPKGD